MNKINRKVSNIWEREKLEKAVDKAHNIKETLDILGIASKSTENYRQFRKYCELYAISFSHFEKNWEKANKVTSYTNEEVFIKHSPSIGKALRQRILKYNIVPYECQICDNGGEWNDRDLTLELDHINGIRNDNRIKNLRFLCPNCHSQQKTTSNKRRYL